MNSVCVRCVSLQFVEYTLRTQSHRVRSLSIRTSLYTPDSVNPSTILAGRRHSPQLELLDAFVAHETLCEGAGRHPPPLEPRDLEALREVVYSRRARGEVSEAEVDALLHSHERYCAARQRVQQRVQAGHERIGHVVAWSG